MDSLSICQERSTDLMVMVWLAVMEKASFGKFVELFRIVPGVQNGVRVFFCFEDVFDVMVCVYKKCKNSCEGSEFPCEKACFDEKCCEKKSCEEMCLWIHLVLSGSFLFLCLSIFFMERRNDRLYFDGQLHIPIVRVEETITFAMLRGLDALVFTNFGNTKKSPGKNGYFHS